MKKKLLTLLVAACLVGCGSSTNFDTLQTGTGGGGGGGAGGGVGAGRGTQTFRTVFNQEAPPADVDSVQVVFRDASGKVVLGPVEVPTDQSGFQIPDVPLTAVRAEVDWLRNGGFALFQSTHVLATTGVLAQATQAGDAVTDPVLLPANQARSVWGTSLSPARFNVTAQGNPGTDVAGTNQVFPVRGVGYSPAPIGTSNKFGPNLGDLFWDGGQNIPGAGKLLDWQKVWQRDVENIRKDFNCVRIYNMLEVQLKDDGSLPNMDTADVRTHLKFLDALWNNGNHPVYAIIGLPSSAAMYLPGGNPAEKEFYQRNMARTVKQLASHPAVMGFTLLNELGGGQEWGGDASQSNFYWSAIQTNSGIVKQAAPDKLVGFAYFDAPGDVVTARDAGLLAQFGNHLDFWAGNVFQSTVLGPSLAPYKTLGAATKPFLFSEFGIPGTSHKDDSICTAPFPTQAGVSSIFSDDTTDQKSADALNVVLPEALNDDIVAGMFYFEWSDEWWKQEPTPNCFETNIITQEGGAKSGGGQFANGYNDEEGYGLHQIALNGRAPNAVFDPFNPNAATANNRPDKLTPRTKMLEAVSRIFNAR